MHTISKKDLNSGEMDTLTTSRSPTTVITANGEVQTHEEATVYVKELDIFLTMKVLENTPAALSLGKQNVISQETIVDPLRMLRDASLFQILEQMIFFLFWSFPISVAMRSSLLDYVIWN